MLRCGFENLISGTYFHSDLVELMRVGGSTQDFDKLEKGGASRYSQNH